MMMMMMKQSSKTHQLINGFLSVPGNSDKSWSGYNVIWSGGFLLGSGLQPAGHMFLNLLRGRKMRHNVSNI